MSTHSHIENFRSQILERQPLQIRGDGSKDFYGGLPAGAVLDTRSYCGVTGYEPTELVITARAGTPLAELESVLAARGQYLACEPPGFGGEPTLGGALASGLSGPSRASVGSLRDFVLGVKIMDGEGHIQTFGGQVMKNVAGFDVSRLMVGSLGTLGLVLEASLKVLPLPVADATLRFDMTQDKALAAMNAWAGRALPLAATCWQDDVLAVRLAGARSAVATACTKLGGVAVSEDEAIAFWQGLRNQTADFFTAGDTVWRLSLPSSAPMIEHPAPTLIEWGGSQRWLRGDIDAGELRETLACLGGHATLFRGGDKSVGVFQALPPALMTIHRRLKQAFDPHGVFNPGRLYSAF